MFVIRGSLYFKVIIELLYKIFTEYVGTYSEF